MTHETDEQRRMNQRYRLFRMILANGQFRRWYRNHRASLDRDGKKQLTRTLREGILEWVCFAEAGFRGAVLLPLEALAEREELPFEPWELAALVAIHHDGVYRLFHQGLGRMVQRAATDAFVGHLSKAQQCDVIRQLRELSPRWLVGNAWGGDV